MKNKIITMFLFIGFFIFSLSTISSLISTCEVYDDFSGGSLDTSKWEIRPDVEGQPLMDEYWVNTTAENFHTQQITLADRRVYLFPTRQFKTGDKIKYEVNVSSKQGTYANMILLTGDQYIRIGMRGPAAGFDEFGIANMSLEFQENNLHIIRITPSQITLIDDLPLTNQNGTYELYIGSFSGSNGAVHMDYDNFEVCTVPPSIEFVNPTTASGNYLQNFIEVNLTFTESNLNVTNITLFNSNGNLINSTTGTTSPLYINFTGLSDGVYSLSASISDTNENTNQTETRTILLDTTSPVFTNIQATSITTSSVTITWTTDDNANSSVSYGTEPNATTSKINSVTLETSHSIYLSSLTALTTYYFNVSSCNVVELCNDSIQFTFTMSAQDNSGSSGGGGGGGGGSSTKYYKCSEWGVWSTCSNAQQTRTCLEKIQTTSSQGVIASKFNETEAKTCISSALTPLSSPTTEESENNNANQETEKELTQKRESFGAGITGAVTGFAKTKGGKTFLIVLGVLVLGWALLTIGSSKWKM